MIERRDLLVCTLLLVAIAALYAPVLDYDFVRFDDPRYVSENPYIAEGVTPQALLWSFTSAYKSNWHPLTWISHMLDLELFGLYAGGHHATNVVLHALNALLLFGVLRSMTGRVWPSGFVAGLFALHPLHIESVAWISERKDVLSTFFGLLSIGCYVRYTRLGGDRRLLASLGLFFLGLLSKPMLVTLPFLLLLLDYWPLGRAGPQALQAGAGDAPRASETLPLRKLLEEKAYFFLVAATVSALTFMAQRAGGATHASDLIPLPLRLANAVVSYVRYIAKTIWPTDLAVHYPHPNLAVVGGTPLPGWLIAGSALMLVLVTLSVILLRRHRYLLVGWLWYLGTLVPAIGIVQVGTQAMADRYTYLPIVGLFIALTWGIADALRSLGLRPPRLHLVLAPLGLAVLAGCSALSWHQLPTWRDSIALFEQALAVSPNDTIILNNLGNELVARGRLDEGIEHYRRALEIAPRYRQALENLGDALEKKAEREAVK